MSEDRQLQKDQDWKRVRVYGIDDRLALSQILLKNGYAVRLTKDSLTSPKNVTYYVEFRDDPESSPVSRSKA